MGRVDTSLISPDLVFMDVRACDARELFGWLEPVYLDRGLVREGWLEAICARQGERDREAMEQAVKDAEGDAVAQLNALFDCCGLWRRDRMDFAALMIRVDSPTPADERLTS